MDILEKTVPSHVQKTALKVVRSELDDATNVSLVSTQIHAADRAPVNVLIAPEIQPLTVQAVAVGITVVLVNPAPLSVLTVTHLLENVTPVRSDTGEVHVRSSVHQLA